MGRARGVCAPQPFGGFGFVIGETIGESLDSEDGGFPGMLVGLAIGIYLLFCVLVKD